MPQNDLTRLVAAILAGGCTVASAICLAIGLRNEAVGHISHFFFLGEFFIVVLIGVVFLLAGGTLGWFAMLGKLPSWQSRRRRGFTVEPLEGNEPAA